MHFFEQFPYLLSFIQEALYDQKFTRFVEHFKAFPIQNNCKICNSTIVENLQGLSKVATALKHINPDDKLSWWMDDALGAVEFPLRNGSAA